MSSISKVAFIGLGAMGYPMAGHLKRSGLDVCVYNRTETKAFAWADEYDGLSAPTPAQAAADAQIVFICVGNDSDVRSVTVKAEGVLSSMKAGTLLVDHTTTSKALAEELHAACDELGISFIDAPVSGGQAGAENGVRISPFRAWTRQALPPFLPNASWGSGPARSDGSMGRRRRRRCGRACRGHSAA